MPLSENPPATTAARANLKATRPVASFIRLSPLSTVVRRAGTRSRSVMALTATASVGETIAPSAKAIASGRPGTSHHATKPTAMVVKITSPMARVRMARRARTNSPQRHQPAVGEEQRRQETQEEEPRVEPEPRERRQQRAPTPPSR